MTGALLGVRTGVDRLGVSVFDGHTLARSDGEVHRLSHKAFHVAHHDCHHGGSRRFTRLERTSDVEVRPLHDAAIYAEVKGNAM